MTIVHIVMLHFKPDVDQAAIDTACAQLYDLQTKCLNESTGKPYIKAISGGKNNSPEPKPKNLGFTHGFVVEFESVEDRNFYLEQDKAHAEFVKGMPQLLERTGVLDFEPGNF